MCNRARNLDEPETLIERFAGGWLTDKPMDNRFNPVELVPRGPAYVIRRDGKANGLDVMSWDLLGRLPPYIPGDDHNPAYGQSRTVADGQLDDVLALQKPYPADRMTVRGPVFPTRIFG